MDYQDESLREETYDQFRVWVHENLRKRPNEKITVRSYSDLNSDSHGPTHMLINLEYVQQGNAYLFSKIKEYDPNAKIVQQDKIEDNGSNYIAYVPYLKHKSHRSSKGKRRGMLNDHLLSPEPNTLYLFGYMFLLFLIVIVGFLKTNRSDWKFITG